MIENGDRIAVGVSGGKDSVALLAGLAGLRRFIGIDYSLVAICLDPQFGGEPNDYSPLAEFCEKAGVEFVLRRTNIGNIIFEDRKEKIPAPFAHACAAAFCTTLQRKKAAIKWPLATILRTPPRPL